MSRSVLAATRSRLFERYPVIASSDLDEVRGQVASVFCEHRLSVVGKSQHLSTQMYFRPGPRAGYGRMSYGAAVDIDPGSLDNFFLLQFPLQGGETIFAEGQPVESTSNLATIVSPAVEFRMRHGKNTEKLFIRLDRQALEREFVQLSGAALKGSLKFLPGIPLDTPQGQALHRYVCWLMQEASDGSLLDHPLVAAQLESTLMAAVLDTLAHNQNNPLRQSSAPAPRFVRLAEEYMAQHAHEPISASDISRYVNVSTRSLFAGFRKYRDTTPMAHLRTLRLEKAHADLSAPSSSDDSVTSIALRWGFSHLGQFAAAYRRSYGETPSCTLRRAGGSPRGAPKNG